MLVWRPWIFWNRALEVKILTRLHLVKMGGHGSVGVFLYKKIQESLLVFEFVSQVPNIFLESNLPSSLTGVYGRIAGLSISGPLNFVRIADAITRPLTWSLSGKAKRNFFVLWLTSSTLSSFKLMKPWSPPVKADLAEAPSNFAFPAATASFALASASFAAPLTFAALSPWL